MAQGIVYVLTYYEPYIEGLVKIGRTTNLKQRLEDLNAEYPGTFYFKFAKEVADAPDVETQLHNHFESYQTEEKKEFFYIAPQTAIEALDKFRGNVVIPRF